MKTAHFIFGLFTLLFLVGCTNPEKQALDSFKPVIKFLSSQTNSDGNITYSDFSYNVEKSTSLVSPFIGLITFKADGSDHKYYYAYTCRFAEQDGKWVHKSIEIEKKFKNSPDQNSKKSNDDDGSNEIQANNDQILKNMNEQVLIIFKQILDKKLSVFLNCPKVEGE